jgi:hypothetical protein
LPSGTSARDISVITDLDLDQGGAARSLRSASGFPYGLGRLSSPRGYSGNHQLPHDSRGDRLIGAIECDFIPCDVWAEAQAWVPLTSITNAT